MTKPPVAQPEQTTAPEPQPVAPTTKPQGQLSGIMIGIMLTFILLALGVVGYLFGSKKITIQTQPTACTTDAKICPDGTSVGRRPPSCEFDPCPTKIVSTSTPSAVSTLAPNPNGNTFYSSAKGVGFYYADKMFGGNEVVVVKEESNKIIVYPQNPSGAAGGQYVEIFTKTTADTLAQAIKKQFLSNIPETDCFVKKQISTDPNIEKATISYPIPADATEPNFTYGEKCPQGYSESNGMAYFWFDTRFPNRYYYFSIGQYGIQAYNGKESPLWQDTFQVLQ